MFLLPSEYEAQPLVAHEAAAAGLPIIATAVHGISDLVANDRCGIGVARSAEGVAEALGRLAEQPMLREQMGETGQAAVAAMTWDASVASVAQVYQGLLSPPVVGTHQEEVICLSV